MANIKITTKKCIKTDKLKLGKYAELFILDLLRANNEQLLQLEVRFHQKTFWSCEEESCDRRRVFLRLVQSK